MEEEVKIESIKVQDFNNKEIDLLEKYKDKALLIIIYNNQCLGCTGRAIPLAYEFQKQFENLQVLGIHSNFGTAEITDVDIKGIFTSDELPFPIYLDEEHKVYDQFNSEGTPNWLIINTKGELHRSFFGSQEAAQNRLSYALAELGF